MEPIMAIDIYVKDVDAKNKDNENMVVRFHVGN